MSSVRLEHLAKSFGDTPVVIDVSLDIADGELLALLGPSGSGKTTLLRLIAGFEPVDSGRILLDGDDVTARPALARHCGMVFQHYALFPHLSVGENVRYGLASAGLSRTDQEARVADVLALVDMADYQDRAVTALSGGQQQRIALARALAPRPKVLLLDEPLSNLDPSLRERTRQELRELVARARITTVLVTHEQDEAFDLAHRVALLHRGRLEQLGSPEALYHAPATRFVASFVGRASAVPGTVIDHLDGKVRVRAGGGDWLATGSASLQGAVTLQLRPESLGFTDAGSITGTVTHHRFAGATAFYRVMLDTGDEIEVQAPHGAVPVGERVHIAATGSGVYAWPAE